MALGAHPHADPVRRVAEQPRRRRRRHLPRRRRAVAGPTPPGAPDDAFVGLDVDLDERGDLGADRRIELPATEAHTLILRRVVLFGALLEPGPLWVWPWPGAPRCWPRLRSECGLSCCSLLRPNSALDSTAPVARSLASCASSVSILRIRGGRAGCFAALYSSHLGWPRRSVRTLAQPGVLPGQGPDRALLAP